MAKHTITFDPDAGIAYGVNLVINTGSNFKDTFTTLTTSASPFNFSNWSGSCQMSKSVSIGSSSYAVATFNVGFSTVSQGKFTISLGSTETRTLKEGRYVYDILVSSGSTTYRIIEGNILVKAGISSSP